ncbi:hypothetical protein [Carnobacterium sp. TMP28]|uniref:hypothetical protein n=1 Tax=Carnobacterium sp. TMP28 TaxID=3397060 RepID=UPI0039E05D88
MLGKEERVIYEKLHYKTVEQYEIVVEEVNLIAQEIYENKQKLYHTILRCVNYYNLFRNTPDEISITIESTESSLKDFTFELQTLEKEIKKIDEKAIKSAAAVTGTGAVVGVLGANILMASATTFGVASTGTAISALSGAAATNAALAWLGGGALVAGGGGIGLGSLVVGLTGPIGWAVGGAGAYMIGKGTKKKNEKMTIEIKKKIDNILEEIKNLKRVTPEIILFRDELSEASSDINEQYAFLSKKIITIDYDLLDEIQRKALSNFVNATKLQAKLLNKRVKFSK